MTEEKETTTELKQCPLAVRCCGNGFMRLKTNDATAFQYFRAGNAGIIMSNVFLSTSLITLAERSVGCKDDQEEGCVGKVFGFKPSSLITIIGTISGLMAAFLLPIIGAIVDYTKHRKGTYTTIATTSIVIQAIQIGTVQATWFPMAILQAINGFLYLALAVAANAYQPEIVRDVGAELYTIYSARYYLWMFGIEALYLIVVSGVTGILLDADDVLTAQFGQGFDVFLSGFFYYISIYYFTHKEPKRTLENGQSLVVAGIKQVGTTTMNITKHYPSTLGRFLIAVIFGQSAISSFTLISVTFINELGFSGNEIGLVFLAVLVSTLPGTFFATWLIKKTSPATSIKVSTIVFIVINFIAFTMLANIKYKSSVWLWAVVWGFLLGWYYPTESLMFSSLMPSGQESELAGFYLYCGQILSWLPPLVFTIFNENPSINIAWGGAQLNIYLVISLVFYFILPSWNKCIEIAAQPNKMIKTLEDDEEKEEFIDL